MKTIVFHTMVLMNNIFNPSYKLFSKQSKRKRKGMALIKPGAGVAQISGSIAGTTFSRNRYGAYARNRSIPVNPNTSAQQKVRSTVSLLSNMWSQTLTAAQRAAWKTYADNVEVLNRLGDSVNLTGFNMYVRSNTALVYNDFDPVDDAPTTFVLGEQDPTAAAAVSAATQNISLTFDTEMAWVAEDNAHLLLYASTGQNATINHYAGSFAIAGTVDGNSTTAPTSPASISMPSPVVAGQKVFFQARIVRADGRLSEPFRFDAVVGA
jgi:hypothetical protein